MILYGAEITAKPGKGGQLAAEVAGIRDAAAGATGQPWSAWAAVAGRPYGSFMLTTRFDGLAELVAGQQAAAASPDFHAVAGGVYGDLASGPAHTTTFEVVAMTGEPSSPQFMVVTQGQMASGRVADGIAWSRRVIEHFKSVTGVDMMVGATAAGQMNRIGFIVGTDTAAELDEVNAALAADTAYRELIDSGGDLISGSFDRVISMRMA